MLDHCHTGTKTDTEERGKASRVRVGGRHLAGASYLRDAALPPGLVTLAAAAGAAGAQDAGERPATQTRL